MMELPTFVVVGHVNKGKSSVVATLIEDPSVPVDWTPGTTRHTGEYLLRHGEQTVLRILDTPGFQEAPAVLEWLRHHAANAGERQAAVARFVREFGDSDRFQDEVELLRPLVEGGAGILYVVDGSRPYRPVHEAEMEILRWTGRPGMALVNRIGDALHLQDWQPVLLQFFNAVRSFDAHQASFAERMEVLRGFAAVRDEWRPAIEAAVASLSDARAHTDRAAAARIAEQIGAMLAHVERRRLHAGEDPARDPSFDEALRDGYRQCLRDLEAEARGAVEALYGHSKLERNSAAFELLDQDLFSETSWKLFGLARRQLLVHGAGWGAALGGGLDLMVGGLSFGTGALLGALGGAAGAWWGSDRLGRVWDHSNRAFRALFPGETGRFRCFGPVTQPAFAWILLDRALSHWHAVRDRAHASKAVLQTESGIKAGVVSHLGPNQRRELERRLKELVQNHMAAGRNKIDALTAVLIQTIG